MTPILIMTGVEILEEDFISPSTVEINGVPKVIQGGLSMTLSIIVKGSGDLSDYVTKDGQLNKLKILADVINGRLKIKTVHEL